MPCVTSARTTQTLLQSCCTTATGCGCGTSSYFASSLCCAGPLDNPAPRNATLCDYLAALDGFSGGTGQFVPALTTLLTNSDLCNCFVGGIYSFNTATGQPISGSVATSLVAAVSCGLTGPISIPASMISAPVTNLFTFAQGVVPQAPFYGPQCATVTLGPIS